MIAPQNIQKDGWFAWAVCLSAFLCNAVITGIDSSFGETIGSIANHFNATERDVAWIGSVHSSAQYFAAFVASPLSNQFGFGPVALFGTLVSTVSFGIAFASTNVNILIVTYGLLGGTGLGLLYTPANIVCTFHFERKQAVAIALANSGAGIGIVAIAFITNFINENYGWKGAILFFAIICPLTGFLAIMLWRFPIRSEISDLPKSGSKDSKRNALVSMTPKSLLLEM
jgi:MFS family permease